MSTLATLAAAALVSSASGVVFTGAGGAIPDATVSNTIANSGLFTSSVGSNVAGEITGIKQVCLTGLVHTWVGDLQIAVIHVASGTRVNLFSRFGVTTATGFGSSKDLNGNYWFVESGAANGAWNPVAGTGNYASGTYNRQTNTAAATVQIGTTSGVQGINNNTFAAFIGLDASSGWQLEVRDFAAGDVGTLGEWSIDFNYIPTPGALALLGLAGIAGRRRRA